MINEDKTQEKLAMLMARVLELEEENVELLTMLREESVVRRRYESIACRKKPTLGVGTLLR